jgi:hypothetical protein
VVRLHDAIENEAKLAQVENIFINTSSNHHFLWYIDSQVIKSQSFLYEDLYDLLSLRISNIFNMTYITWQKNQTQIILSGYWTVDRCTVPKTAIDFGC